MEAECTDLRRGTVEASKEINQPVGQKGMTGFGVIYIYVYTHPCSDRRVHALMPYQLNSVWAAVVERCAEIVAEAASGWGESAAESLAES